MRLYMERKGFASLGDVVNGMTLLHCACEDSEAQRVEQLCYWMPFSVNEQAIGPKCVRMTALHIAAQGVRADLRSDRCLCIRHLAAARADLEAKKDRDMTPFLVAAATLNQPGLELLCELRADVSAQTDNGTTALDLAWANKRCQYLLTSMGVRRGAGQLGSGRFG